MLDIRYIRDNAESVQTNAKNKGYTVDIAALIKLDDERRDLQNQADELRQKRNANVAQAKGARPTDEQIADGKAIKEQLTTIEPRLEEVSGQYIDLLKKVPNMALSDVPIGTSEEQSIVVKTVGEIPKFDFTPRNHADIAGARGWLDKERAAKVSGSRFAYIEGDLVARIPCHR